jgi:hypothetical protein
MTRPSPRGLHAAIAPRQQLLTGIPGPDVCGREDVANAIARRDASRTSTRSLASAVGKRRVT